jgi:hypothetical protein
LRPFLGRFSFRFHTPSSVENVVESVVGSQKVASEFCQADRTILIL